MLPEHAQAMSIGRPGQLDREVRRRAVLSICFHAHSAEDADELIHMLGLDPVEGRPIDQDDDTTMKDIRT